jgi:hypothetical protein
MGKKSKRTEKLNLPLAIEPAESSDRLEVRRTAKLYIGGAFPRSESGRSREVQLAKGGVANIAGGSRKDLREAVRVARIAAEPWAARTAMVRGQILYRVAELMEGRAAQIRDAVQAWLLQEARILFAQRLDHYAPLLQVQWRKLTLSSAGTRWGSARVDGSIRLHWRLIHFKLSVIDYVVVHELSHLRVMDHSPRFWDTVRQVVPDYAELRSQLKDEMVPKW